MVVRSAALAALVSSLIACDPPDGSPSPQPPDAGDERLPCGCYRGDPLCPCL